LVFFVRIFPMGIARRRITIPMSSLYISCINYLIKESLNPLCIHLRLASRN
jgi:hypothetical protein